MNGLPEGTTTLQLYLVLSKAPSKNILESKKATFIVKFNLVHS